MINLFDQEPRTSAWIIDQDHLDLEDLLEDYEGATGTTGPSDAPQDLLDRLEAGEAGHQFKIYDDDGELYYTGRALFRDEDGNEAGPHEVYEVEVFGPLYDFAAPNDGAVEIQYLINGKWESI